MNPNEVLLWLSAKGEGTWSRYRAAVDELAFSGDSDDVPEDAAEGVLEDGGLSTHLRIRLNLERLGHAEFFCRDFPNGWRVVPPTMIIMANDHAPLGLLCGARPDSLMLRLREASPKIRIETVVQEECPDRITVQASNLSELRKIASRAGLIFEARAVELLLRAVPPIDNYQYRSPVELPFGEDWKVSRYSVMDLGWFEATMDDVRQRPFGLFRIHNLFRPEYYLKLHGSPYKVQVQVGKYVLLRYAHRKVLTYDDDRRILTMPISCRPPPLLDRALTLCAGLIPRIKGGYLEYTNVERANKLAVTTLLRQ